MTISKGKNRFANEKENLSFPNTPTFEEVNLVNNHVYSYYLPIPLPYIVEIRKL